MAESSKIFADAWDPIEFLGGPEEPPCVDEPQLQLDPEAERDRVQVVVSLFYLAAL